MFGQRSPFLINNQQKKEATDDKVNQTIQSEVHDIVSKRDRKRLTIEEMVQDIEEALAYIGYVDTSTQENKNSVNQPINSTTESDSDVEIL